MKRNISILSVTVMFAIITCGENKSSEKVSNETNNLATIKLHAIAENLFSPVGFAHANDERLFILEQPGRIKIIKDGKVLAQPFLDISNKVESGRGYSEKGLLGLAFHPQFKSNGRFFIYYSTHSDVKDSDHKSVIAEYTVSPSNPDLALTQEKIILHIEQPESNHNGGQLAFGPDGFLYISLGDGGGAGDKHGGNGNGQNLGTLLGKILRIDINTNSPYSIPNDNPFTKTPGVKHEIWAYGLRNPWRFSFDRKTGLIFCGDVGQNSFEEIDLIEKGKNYGWRAMEGNHPFDKKIKQENMQAPIYDYPRNIGISVIGGYVYRGSKMKEWEGKYFFGDWKGKLFYLEKEGSQWVSKPLAIDSEFSSGFTINSFGEDKNGELYILGQKEIGANSNTGIIFKLINAQ